MVSSKKRGRQEMEVALPQEDRPMIERIRNMWEFANLAQWIYIFGKAVKIDEDLDIEDLEMECIKSHSTVLPDIGLALLKFISSHRGLTPEIFNDYTRRQYMAKAPQRNPFGTEEEPAKFIDFDSFTKIRVLQQLTQWTMINPDRIRERMEEQKDSDQAYWRIEPFGWDSEDRTYIVLDDNRLYRQTAPPPPPPPAAAPKKNSKKSKAALRASKRRKLSELEVSEEEAVSEPVVEDKEEEPVEDNGLGGLKWECLAITLEDLIRFVASIEKSRDPNEKILRTRITEDLLPLLEKQEEARKRKAAQKERELLNLEKLATAKRSSRIAGKLELQRQEEETREVERKKLAELTMAKREQEKWIKLEKERESRMMTREQRLKEREARRILHEEELAGLSEDSKKLEAGESRLSERHLKAEIEKKKQALEELAEEDDWVFDCICGAYGQVDDGSHSISCEKCNIWQHTKCVGITEAAANRDDFHFVCKSCRHRAEEAEKAKHRPTIKIKFNRPAPSSSPAPLPQLNSLPANTSEAAANGAESPGMASQRANSAYHVSPPRPEYESPYLNSRKLSFKPHSPTLNGINHTSPTPANAERTPVSQSLPNSTQQSPNMNGFSPRPTFQPGPYTNGGLAFSTTHPYSPTSLLPPPQNRDYTSINGQSLSDTTGTHALPSASQYNLTANAQSYQRPTLPMHAAPDTKHEVHPMSPEQTKLNGRPQREANKSPLAQLGQPQNQPQKSYLNQSQQRASGALPISLAAVALPTHLPPTGGYGSAFSKLSMESPASGQLPLNTPSVQLGSHNSTPTGQPKGSFLKSDSSHASALPPATTGISPTKHSPPRSTTANGLAALGSATPSVLPPIALLSPSSEQPNLTPPVKSAEPEKNRLLGFLHQLTTTNDIATSPSVLSSALPPVQPLSSSPQLPNPTPPVESAKPEKDLPSSQPTAS